MAGWQRHSEGQLAMFLARGPDSFVSGVSHQLFADSRINIVSYRLVDSLLISRNKFSDIYNHYCIDFIGHQAEMFNPVQLR